jgi:methylphosphotriester-DNA--protein-cysteine methyltransferase
MQGLVNSQTVVVDAGMGSSSKFHHTLDGHKDMVTAQFRETAGPGP